MASGLDLEEGPRSAPYEPHNLLDRLSKDSTLEVHYRHLWQREQRLLARRLGITSGEVLSVGCGWHPGRDLFPSPAFRLVAVDADQRCVSAALEAGSADAAVVGDAGNLQIDLGPFDVVLYRLVLHHIAFQGPIEPCFDEAARLLRPGGALVAVEPGLWHPVGLGLALANRVGIATLVHGTPDDLPLSPRTLVAAARASGLSPELHAVTYSWRRVPPRLQRALHSLNGLGSRPRSAPLGHTLLLIARKP